MSRRLLASVLGLLALLLAVGAATATAADPVGVQTVDQSAASGQQATAASGATQVNPTNTNISVRVLSPGDDGSVTQTNSVGSTALAGNENTTGQLAGQTQAGSGGIQTADQSASNTQLAGALSTATQYGASNANLPIRVGSYGNGGSVTQTNAVDSTAVAANENSTGQLAGQTQAGGGGACCPGGGTGIQTTDQSATSTQAAGAHSSATQLHPKNVNISVRVLSPGNDGSVTQTNAVESKAVATNDNETKQGTLQTDLNRTPCGCSADTSIQTATQKSDSGQLALAGSTAKQDGAKNVNLPIRVASPGSSGPVKQVNVVGSTAIAANDNDTKQLAGQSQAGTAAPCCPAEAPRHGDAADKAAPAPCCTAGTSIQTVDQSSKSLQGAAAFSVAKQEDAKNVNMPIRVGSKGNDGSVFQANVVDSKAIAANDNKTIQLAGQSQAGGAGIGVQTANQGAFSGQLAAAGSAALQSGASNDNSPIRVGSPGGGGSVTQINAADSTAKALNANGTLQWADQDQLGGRGCPCGHGIGIQATGQKAVNAQLATATSAAVQDFGKSKCGCPSDGNTNSPIRVGSWGDDGRVLQANTVSSNAVAANLNHTIQAADQKQLGHGGIAIQALGQEAKSLQAAEALSLALQFGASNVSKPIRVWSPGGGGSVIQANDVHSGAFAGNANGTKQLAGQTQVAPGHCGCAPIAIQALGQSAFNLQAAKALSAAFQLKPENTNAPTSVWSHGGSGSVLQLNAARSAAAALNGNWTLQLARQLQA